jgi:hypothetical protein
MTTFGVLELFPLLDPERRRHGGASIRAGILPADRQERPHRPRGEGTHPRLRSFPPSDSPLLMTHENAIRFGSDRIGSDRIGSDRIGSDQIRSDQIRSDQIRIRIRIRIRISSDLFALGLLCSALLRSHPVRSGPIRSDPIRSDPVWSDLVRSVRSSGADIGGEERAQAGVGVPTAGSMRALLPVRRQDASPNRSAPVPPAFRVKERAEPGNTKSSHRELTARPAA